VLLLHWERTVGELMDRTADFPRRVRASFAVRIESIGLDILEGLIAARWARRSETPALLAQADTKLQILGVLVRLAYSRQYLSRRGFEQLVRELDEAGRMLGGWRRSFA
jgi:hypothetical protein